MARPKKKQVAYFPHDADASDGKTLTILQSKFGNDGYAFWFRLLEILGRAPGHYYDYNNPADWEFLLAKTHQKDTVTAKAILKTLATLGAIDPDLNEKGIIWSQNFVDGIADAYSRTKEGPPKKPELDNITKILCNIEKGVNVEKQGVNVKKTELMYTETPKNITETPQKEIEKEIEREISSSNSKDEISEKVLSEITTIYEQEIGHITPMAADTLKDLISHYPRGWIIEAISLAVRSNRRSARYVEGILKKWETEGKGGKNGSYKKYIPGQEPAGAFADIDPFA